MEVLMKGSFNWYLFHSGSFVTTVAKAIQLADADNLEKLRLVFPQMVAAFELRTWDSVPEEFESNYNSERK
jgi:hypothetical protein